MSTNEEFKIELEYDGSKFDAGIGKSAKKAEGLADGIEKVEKGAKKTFAGDLPKSVDSSEKAFETLSKSAQKLRDRIEKAASKQSRKDFDKLSAEASRLNKQLAALGASSTKGFNNVKRNARGTLPVLGNLRSTLGGLNSAFFALGSVAAAGAGAKEFVGHALELERATAEVSTIVDTTKVNVGALSSEVREMAAAFGIDGVDATKSLYQAISAGVEPAKALGVLTESSKMATAGIATMEESVDLMTSTLNAYGFDTSQAAAVSDSFFQTVKDGKTTIPELAASIGKVAPMAASAGVSLFELNAATATLTASGLSTSEAFTGTQQIMKAFLKPTAEATAAAAKLGINFNATELASKGLEGVMAELQQALSDASMRGEDTTEIIQQLMGRVEGANAAVILTGKGFNKFNDSLKNNKNALGASDEAAQKMQNTVGFKLKAAYETVKIEAMKFGAQVLGNLDTFVDFIGGTEGVKRALTALGSTFKLQFHVIGGLAKFIWRVFDGVSDFFAGFAKIVWNNIQIVMKGFQAVKAAVSGDFEEAFKHGGEVVNLFTKNISTAESSMRSAGTKLGSAFTGGFEDVVNFKDSVMKHVDNVSAFVGGLNTGPTIKTPIALNRPSVGEALRVDRSQAMNNALQRMRRQEDKARLEEQEAFAKEQLKIQKEQEKESLRLQKEQDRELRRLQKEEERERKRVLRDSGRGARRALGGSLASAFRGGVSDATPAFRDTLARALVESAQPGVTFRGSSLQVGQGTRQQLQDSLFNREATGRQLATNIQLLAAGFAGGGTVPGPDMGRDSMLVPLRGQEEVIRPEAARPNRALLQLINRSRGPVALPSGRGPTFRGAASSNSTVNTRSNSSSVNSSSVVTDNRQMVNIREINVQGGAASAEKIASAVIKQMEYKARRGLLNMRAS